MIVALLLSLPRRGVRGALTSRAGAPGVVGVLAAPGEGGCRRKTERSDVGQLGRSFPTGCLERGSWGLRRMGIGAGGVGLGSALRADFGGRQPNGMSVGE